MLKINEIDEFRKISLLGKDISKDIVKRISRLNEKEELEPLIRELLFDYNETAHGPAEIVDILTSKVHLKGKKVFCAFILKGKSSKNLKSKDIAHQFLKLKQIPNLDMILLCVVGNYNDDVPRDFINTANDMNVDYIIIDNIDLARLFLAYDKICPIDGSLFNEAGFCKLCKQPKKNNIIYIPHKKDELMKYDLLNLRDLSHAAAKRYSAAILVNQNITRDLVKDIIIEANNKVKNENYYRSDITRNRWKEKPAHIVWLFVGNDEFDMQNSIWVCKSIWINESLDDKWKPSCDKGDEVVDGINIYWNNDYEKERECHKEKFCSKNEIISKTDESIKKLKVFAEFAVDLFDKYNREIINEVYQSNLLSHRKQEQHRLKELIAFAFPSALRPQ